MLKGSYYNFLLFRLVCYITLLSMYKVCKNLIENSSTAWNICSQHLQSEIPEALESCFTAGLPDLKQSMLAQHTSVGYTRILCGCVCLCLHAHVLPSGLLGCFPDFSRYCCTKAIDTGDVYSCSGLLACLPTHSNYLTNHNRVGQLTNQGRLGYSGGRALKRQDHILPWIQSGSAEMNSWIIIIKCIFNIKGPMAWTFNFMMFLTLI